MKFHLVRPCAHCPFRSDIRPYLNRERVALLKRELARKTFACHETLSGDGTQQHCAGALIFLERLRRPSQMMRIAERLGIYDRRKLDMRSSVVASFAEMVEK